jgi:hypothetical protein
MAGTAHWDESRPKAATMTLTSILSARHQRGRRGHLLALACALSYALALTAVLALGACSVKENHNVQVTPQIVPTELFVAPDGLDSNPGTRASPLRSLARAAQLVTPGTFVNVLPGAYQGGFRTTIDGLPNARIVYRSTLRWGARIVPPAVSNSTVAWDNRASYTDIQGFEIDGSARLGDTGKRWTIGIEDGGAYDRIAGDHVHDIAATPECTDGGGAGILVGGHDKGTDADVSGNSVHDIGPRACRSLHGIDIGTAAGIRNNIVYRVGDAGIHLRREARHVVVANNTVTASNTGILVGGAGSPHDKRPDDRTQVYNNIVFDNRYGVSDQGGSGRRNSYRNNLVFKNSEADWRLAPGIVHAGTVAAAPGFVDYSREGTPDFRLAARSPAIGKGLEQGADGPDFFGKMRARASTVDIGACQH